MITIVVTHEDDQSDEFDFDSSQSTISIGRRSTNDVCIPNLSVSGRHARIVFNDGEAWVEDLNSTNGTYIRNRLISRQMLNHGDELVIGKTRVSYVNQTAGATLNSVAVRTNAANAQPVDALANDMADYVDGDLDAAVEDDQADAQSDAQSDVLAEAAPIPEPIASIPVKAKPAVHSSEALFESLADDLEGRQLDESVRTKEQASFDDDFDDLPGDFGDDLGADDAPMSLSDKAKLALGRMPSRPTLAAVNGNHQPSSYEADDDVIEAEPPVSAVAKAVTAELAAQHTDSAAELDTVAPQLAPTNAPDVKVAPSEEKSTGTRYTGAVIEIKNGAKSGQRLPIDKPVTTLGRPGIQIAAIMRKPDGYFLMHIESDDSVDRPTLNSDAIGDEPMLLQSGDELNVAGIDVEFSLA